MNIISCSYKTTSNGRAYLVTVDNGFTGEHITVINSFAELRDMYNADAHYIGTVAASENGEFTVWCIYENDTYSDIHYAIRWEEVKRNIA